MLAVPNYVIGCASLKSDSEQWYSSAHFFAIVTCAVSCTRLLQLRNSISARERNFFSAYKTAAVLGCVGWLKPCQQKRRQRRRTVDSFSENIRNCNRHDASGKQRIAGAKRSCAEGQSTGPRISDAKRQVCSESVWRDDPRGQPLAQRVALMERLKSACALCSARSRRCAATC